MRRYVVERVFPGGLAVSRGPAAEELWRRVVERNGDLGVTWLHYVTEDKERSFCVYDAPGPEAILAAAERNELPVTRITAVRVLDPYFYS